MTTTNYKDRSQAAKLISSEFEHKKLVAKENTKITQEKIAQESAVIVKEHNLDLRIQEILQLREKLNILQSELSRDIVNLKNPVSSKGRKKKAVTRSCECYDGDFEYYLSEFARTRLESRFENDTTVEELCKQSREIIAEVMLADSKEKLEQLLVRAGVIKRN